MIKWRQIMVGVVAVGTLCIAGLTPASGSAPTPPPTPNSSPAARPAIAPAITLPEASGTVFVPITPCRIVDTRNGSGTNGNPFSNGETRTYYVGGTFGFAPQGGTAGGCGIPVGAKAVAATMTALSPQHPGFVRAWPNGLSEPNATILNYSDSNTGTGATLSIASSAYSLKVKNYGGPVGLIIDVTGYYNTQIHAVLNSTGGISSGSDRVLNSVHLGTGSYRVQISGDLVGCTPIASIDGSAYFASSYMSGNYVYANTYNPAGTTVDLYWTLTVIC